MPRPRRRARTRREPLSDEIRAHFESGTPLYLVDGHTLRALWGAHGAEVTKDWVRAHPGTRPWAWWQYVATSPRRVLEGAHLATPTGPWWWRARLGVPAFQQARRPGDELPLIESEAAYLDRHGMLAAEERAALPADAFEPVAVNPFLIEVHENGEDDD